LGTAVRLRGRRDTRPRPCVLHEVVALAPESGTLAAEPADTSLPMSPYYFPFVTQTPGNSTQGHLTGYFDYRPKDTEEGLVVAHSTDGGKSWNYAGKALEEEPGERLPDGGQQRQRPGSPVRNERRLDSYLYTVNRPAGDNLGGRAPGPLRRSVGGESARRRELAGVCRH